MTNLKIEELQRIIPSSIRLSDHIGAMQKNTPNIIMRSFPKAPALPITQPGIKIYGRVEQTPADIQNAYGTHPNVSGTEVVNAIAKALGGGGWAFHVSDGSYTAYSSWELREYIGNFDSTNLQVWIAETFDCDNFATVLNGKVQGFFKGIPFGILWFDPKDNSWGHAVNIFYDAYAKKVYCVEPQTDGFFDFNQAAWNPWMVLI
jgi:hypothetical protein